MDLVHLVAALFLCVTAFVQNVYSESMARGFNDDIDWLSMDEGLEKAEATNKPVMVLIHKSWCGACKQLKPHFTTSKEIEKLSKQFVMINVQDQEEDDISPMYAELGKYIPRIVFAESDGQVRGELWNGQNADYPYFYSSADQVVDGMRRALAKLRGEQVRDGREL